MYSDKADKGGKFCTVLCITLFNVRSAEQFLAILHAVVFHLGVRKLANSMKMCAVIHNNFVRDYLMRRKKVKISVRQEQIRFHIERKIALYIGIWI